MSPKAKQNRGCVPGGITLALVLVAGLAGCGGGNEAGAPLPPPQPQILTQSLPDGTVGLDYNASLVAASGTPPFTWSVTAGNLPAGLVLDSSTGDITGNPTTAATFTFTIEVTDSEGQSASRAFTVTISDTTPLVELVSVASDGTPGNGDSGSPAVSDTGRFIAFTSFATNLVANDTNNFTDIFLRDRTCSVTVRVSVANDATQGNSNSFAPAISALVSGTLFVAYASDANNLAELLSRTQAEFSSATTIGNSTLELTPDAHVGQLAEIVAGTGAGQTRTITANDATTLTVDPAWNPIPDATSFFRVSNDTNNARDIFVTAVDVPPLPACGPTPVSTARVSVANDGTEGDVASNLPSISSPAVSGPGTLAVFVAYHSSATNLVDVDTNNVFDIFVTELQFSGLLSVVRTRGVSTFKIGADQTADIFSDTTIGNSTLNMTPDEHVGRLVEIVQGTGAGQSRTITANDATTFTVDPAWDPLVPNTTADIFSSTTIGSSTLNLTPDEHVGRLVEIVQGTGAPQTRTITTHDATTFTVATPWTPVPDDTSVFRVPVPDSTSVFRIVQQSRASSLRARLSADAAFVGFDSRNQFDAGDTNVVSDGFVHELSTDRLTRVSVDTAGALSNGTSTISALSANGNFVLFQSAATNLVTGDTNATADFFVRDRVTPETTRVSLADDGSEASGASDFTAGLSGGGRLVVFASFASNLVPDDRNLVRDIFLRDRQTGTTRRLSLGLGGINPNNESFDPAISLDGTTVAFASAATNLVLNDINAARDIFVATTSIVDPLTIVVSRLPAARRGSPYAGRLWAVGGRKPLFWAVSEGALPPGLFLDPNTGWIRGIPQQEGRFRFTVLVIDAERPANMSRRTLTLRVRR